jgi:hypothetical protein
MDKSLSSIARLALIAAGGAAAVVTFTGGITSPGSPVSPVSAAHPGGTAAGQPAQRYVARLVAFQAQTDKIYSQQFTLETPYSQIIYSQTPPDGGAPYGQA